MQAQIIQTQIIQTSRFDFQRIYVNQAPEKTPKAQPVKTKTVKAETKPAPAPANQAKKAVRVILKETPQPAPQPAAAEIARPHLAKIAPLPKVAPLPKIAPLPKVAPLPANCAAYTPETIQAELAMLYTLLDKYRATYAEHSTEKNKAKLLSTKALIKEACFIRSKIAPIPTLPKIKTVTVTGYAESVYHGTDAQILVHLRNMAKSQRVASKEGLPFEGMKMTVTHN